MRILLQRVSQARVAVEGTTVGGIGKGLLLLLGVHRDDTTEQADFLAAKCANLRVFNDSDGRMNLSVNQVGGGALVVSQFTLFGDCRKGNRPSYIEAAGPDKGNELYEYFVSKLKQHISTVETGEFGATMAVELINDGPVTLVLER